MKNEYPKFVFDPHLFTVFKLLPANNFMIDLDEEHDLSVGNTHQIIQSQYWGKVDHLREWQNSPGPLCPVHLALTSNLKRVFKEWVKNNAFWLFSILNLCNCASKTLQITLNWAHKWQKFWYFCYTKIRREIWNTTFFTMDQKTRAAIRELVRVEMHQCSALFMKDFAHF